MYTLRIQSLDAQISRSATLGLSSIYFCLPQYCSRSDSFISEKEDIFFVDFILILSTFSFKMLSR